MNTMKTVLVLLLYLPKEQAIKRPRQISISSTYSGFCDVSGILSEIGNQFFGTQRILYSITSKVKQESQKKPPSCQNAKEFTHYFMQLGKRNSTLTQRLDFLSNVLSQYTVTLAKIQTSHIYGNIQSLRPLNIFIHADINLLKRERKKLFILPNCLGTDDKDPFNVQYSPVFPLSLSNSSSAICYKDNLELMHEIVKDIDVIYTFASIWLRNNIKSTKRLIQQL